MAPITRPPPNIIGRLCVELKSILSPTRRHKENIAIRVTENSDNVKVVSVTSKGLIVGSSDVYAVVVVVVVM